MVSEPVASERELHVVVYGATGYTGRLVVDYVAREAPAELRWAIGGRDRTRLERLRDELAAAPGGGAPPPSVRVADAADATSLEELARSTRVVCSTVGPYARHGSELVAACVRAGTHYCDLTGEVPWIRRMIDAHHGDARSRGARIVHCCGFDSIPSDLGVWMLHRAMVRTGWPLEQVDAFFGETSGGFSGGTVASLLGVLDEVSRDPDARRLLADPYALDPLPRRGGPDGPDARGVHREARLRAWTAPFLMAPINTRVVRRTNALLGYPYGREFRYREQMSLPGNLRGLATAAAISAAHAGLVAAAGLPPLRALLARRLPAPGEGPSADQRARGHFVVRLLAGHDRAQASLRGRVADRRDPGYGSTAVMLSQSALCLALDPLIGEGGVLTPAAAMGDALLERLRAAGLTFEVEGAAAA